MTAVSQDTQTTLERISLGELDLLEASIGLREVDRAFSGLDARAFSLVKIAALIALDAPPASYAWQIANAQAEGVSAEDIIGVLGAIAPQVGGPRLIAAAPEIMLALGLDLPESSE
ncbi:MAG: carboxymuconolactone decarboxylase family protein [Solirubrobacteraceae bacterium]